MRKAVLCFTALCCSLLLSASVAAQSSSLQTISVDQIHAGMRGVALTVFQGVKPEPMDVEVLGVMRNANGPKGDVILVRLVGTKPEYTGVVAGMSGSPVYFDGKLAGALAFRIGEFSKEPIAGVTPIAEMMEIDALDQRPAADPHGHDLAVARRKRHLTVGMMAERTGLAKSTYARIEKGDPAVAMGAYAMALFVLGFGEVFGNVTDAGRDEDGSPGPVRLHPLRGDAGLVHPQRLADGSTRLELGSVTAGSSGLRIA